MTWKVHEGGVAWVERTTLDLRSELRVKPGNGFVLRVRGQWRSTGVFYMKKMRAPRRGAGKVDDIWDGTEIRLSGKRVIRFVDRSTPALVQDFRCRRKTAKVRERAMDILWCAPLHQHKGFPWRDPLPSYARLPLIFAIDGDVYVTMGGEQGKEASVDIVRTVPRSPL